jgi:hypothetical protein
MADGVRILRLSELQRPLLKVEAAPETTLQEVTCLSCGGPLPARKDKFNLKYFLLRKAARAQKWRTNRKPQPASGRG